MGRFVCLCDFFHEFEHSGFGMEKTDGWVVNALMEDQEGEVFVLID